MLHTDMMWCISTKSAEHPQYTKKKKHWLLTAHKSIVYVEVWSCVSVSTQVVLTELKNYTWNQ